MVKFNHEQIIKLYNNNLSTKDIKNQLGCSVQTIHNVLNAKGIKVSRYLVRRKYNFDYTVFDKIDTEEKAYWLGFIYADGCIVEMKNKRKYFSIGLAEKDKEHLEKLREFLGYSDSIKKKKNGCWYLIINNINFVNSLSYQGVYPRKSLSLKFPLNIPQELINHFIRGYFDGDGSVYYTKNKKYLRISICSAKTFSDKMIENCKYFKKVEIEKIDRLQINSQKNIKVFYKQLYNLSTIYLERKKQIFDNFYKEKGSETIISRPNRIKE